MIFVLANNNNPGLESAAYNKSFYGNLHKWLINKCLEQVLYMFVLLALIEKKTHTIVWSTVTMWGLSNKPCFNSVYTFLGKKYSAGTPVQF